MIGGAEFQGAVSGLTTAVGHWGDEPAGRFGGEHGQRVMPGPLTLGADATVTAPLATFAAVDGAFALTVVGSATFGGAVGGSVPLTSLTAGSPSARIGHRAPQRNRDHDEQRTDVLECRGDRRGYDTHLNRNNGSAGNIRFAGTVDGPHQLTVHTAGVTEFDAAVGAASPLTAFATDAAGRTSLAVSVTTTGAISIPEPLTLTGDVSLTDAQSGGAGIALASVDSDSATIRTFTVSTPPLSDHTSLNLTYGSVNPARIHFVQVPLVFADGDGQQRFDHGAEITRH